MTRYLLAVAVLTISSVASARAQTTHRCYAGAGIGSFSVSADDVDGRSVATSIVGGVALWRHVDAEVEVALPAESFARSYSGPSESFAPLGASYDERIRLSVITRFDKTRDVTSSLSAVVIFRPALGQRVAPAVIVGVSNQRVRDRTVYTPISIPDGVNPQHPAVVVREESSTRNIGGPTFGAQVAFALTPHFSIVPDVRYDYGSIGDEINNALRASVRAQWRF